MCSLSPIFDTHVHFRIFETFPSLLLGHCVSCNTRSNQFPSLFSTISLFTISSYKKILSHNWTIWYNFREYLVSLVDINFSKYFNERPLNVSIITIQFFERVSRITSTNYPFTTSAFVTIGKKKLRYKFFWHFNVPIFRIKSSCESFALTNMKKKIIKSRFTANVNFPFRNISTSGYFD